MSDLTARAEASPPTHSGTGHDHTACVAQALVRAEQVCARAGARLTRSRRQVLELVWDSHKPVKAYGLLEALQKKQGRMVNPPTVYRALDFLLEHKLVHRIQALNAFVGCSDPVKGACGCLLICDTCHQVYDMPLTDLESAVQEQADRLGFSVETQIMEVFGRCAACAQPSDGKPLGNATVPEGTKDTKSSL